VLLLGSGNWPNLDELLEPEKSPHNNKCGNVRLVSGSLSTMLNKEIVF